MIKIKRVYEPSSPQDGFRVLVDRLWPRGLSKESAGVDLWIKEIAPSDKLRKWFSHDPKKWAEFKKRYASELDGRGEIVENLRSLAKEKGKITLVYGAKDEKYNNAVFLQEFLGKSQ
ncbi:MAG TPA: DUF488 domain-containing protein [Candidatus Nitrosotalea sp.]|nr:DUF488 domain-containing protein [Candidatus Nitrosotalea sp.]